MTSQSDTTPPLTFADDFPDVSLEEWAQLVTTASKVDAESLTRITADGISIKPLYTGSTETGATKIDPLPGQFPYLRGNLPFGQADAGWRVQQSFTLNHVSSTNSRVLDALTHGVNELRLLTGLTHTTQTDESTAPLTQLLDGVRLQMIGLHWQHAMRQEESNTMEGMTHFTRRVMSSARSHLALLKNTDTVEPTHARGNLGLDPISFLISASAPTTNNGTPGKRPERQTLEAALSTFTDDALAIASECHPHYPALQPLLVDLTTATERGATPVQELSLMLAGLKFNLQLLLSAGLTPAHAIKQIGCTLTTDTDYFMGVAKLRAARALWAQLANACGVPEVDATLPLTVQTSRRMMTRYEPTNNIMRAAIAAAAAALAGAETIDILPYNALLHNSADNPSEHPDTDRALRVARNTAWLLMEESGLHRVVDPLAGSDYIDSLTHQLCESAWQGFQQFESAGSLLDALPDIHEALATADREALKEVRLGQRRIIGTTDYAALDNSTIPSGDGTLTLTREFEQLRDAVEQHTLTSSERPALSAIVIGERPAYLPRFEFTRNLLATAGIALREPHELRDTMPTGNDMPSAIIVICADPSISADTVNACIQHFQHTHTVLVVEKPSRLALDISDDQYLYRGMDQLGKLQHIAALSGVKPS